jgi:hypothetical protein
MSNRVLAIVCFAIFMVAFVYEGEMLQMKTGMAFSRSSPAPAPTMSASNPRLEAFFFMAVLELGLANELRVLELKAAHPELADEIDYQQFAASVSLRNNAAGTLEFQPLRKEYEKDYEAFKARYLAKYPKLTVPE